MVRRILLPAVMPAYVLSLRAGLGLGWMFVVAAEFLGASTGLGYLLIDGQQLGKPAQIVAAIVTFGILGKTTDFLLARATAPFLRWEDVFRRAVGDAMLSVERSEKPIPTACARSTACPFGSSRARSSPWSGLRLRQIHAAARDFRPRPGHKGSVTLNGTRITAPHEKIGMIFQEPRLLPWLSVANNVGFGLAHLPAAERKGAWRRRWSASA